MLRGHVKLKKSKNQRKLGLSRPYPPIPLPNLKKLETFGNMKTTQKKHKKTQFLDFLNLTKPLNHAAYKLVCAVCGTLSGLFQVGQDSDLLPHRKHVPKLRTVTGGHRVGGIMTARADCVQGIRLCVRCTIKPWILISGRLIAWKCLDLPNGWPPGDAESALCN